MKRILLSSAIVIAVGAFLFVALGASNSSSAVGTYKVEIDNAFGLVQGADFKVAGVRAGTINKLDLCYSDPQAHCQNPYHALVTVQVTVPGLSSFHADAFCQSRPQSLIGEYFVECQPGHSGPVIKPGSTIPVSRTASTIPADFLQNVMRMPYRERFTLIINELGAAVAGRSGDLAAALRRAVPALTETDNLLNLLGNDSNTLQQLTSNSDAVITALANNSAQVQRFIVEANNAATDTATQQANLQLTLQRLPPFLEQLRPALSKLGAATDANLPVLANLNAAAGQLNRLLTDLPSFSRSARPALKSLGQASLTGITAVRAARPTVTHLNTFAQSAPELGQNLAIVLHDLDSRNRAVEKDPRSPGGQGYTGLEALLQYVFNQPLAINTFGPFGHQLTVDAFVSVMCTPYATPATIAMQMQTFGSRYRQCYSWLGPHQPGVNSTDPSAPGAAVPDPGGVPPGEPALATSARKLAAADTSAAASASTATGATSGASTAATTLPTSAAGASGSPGTVGSGAAGAAGGAGSAGGSGLGLGKALGQIFSALGGNGSAAASPSGSSSSDSNPGAAGTSTGATSTGGTGSGGSNQTQALLNYLLSP
jgi:virulence factor Mce-like protein